MSTEAAINRERYYSEWRDLRGEGHPQNLEIDAKESAAQDHASISEGPCSVSRFTWPPASCAYPKRPRCSTFPFAF